MAEGGHERAVVTVLGEDRIGIIAAVSAQLASRRVNIMDISQTTVGGIFSMVMWVDLAAMTVPLDAMVQEMEELGQRLGLIIQMRHMAIFAAMHRLDREEP